VGIFWKEGKIKKRERERGKIGGKGGGEGKVKQFRATAFEKLD
jgi:hypothetical protein